MKALDPRLLRHARTSRGYLAAAAGIGLVQAGLLVAQAALLAHVVTGAFLGHRGPGELRGAFVALGAVVVARAVLVWAAEVVAHRSAAAVKSELRLGLLRHAVDLGPAFLAGERSGELAVTAGRGLDALDTWFARYLPQLVLAALVPIAVLGWLVPVDLTSVAIMAVTVPLIPVFMSLIGWAADARTKRQWQALSLLSAHFLDVLQGLPTLRVFGRGRAQVTTIRAVSDRFRRATMGTLRVAFLSALVLELLATISTALVAVAIGLRLVDGRLGFEAALTVLVLTPEVYLPLRQVAAQFHASTEGLAAAQRVFDVLETPLPGRVAGHAGGPDAGAVPDPAAVEVRVEGATLTYPGRDRPALDAIDLVLRPGERVAVVGPSGAGKSTLAALLLGFVHPDHGRITAGGADVASVPPDAWRRRIAWVPQRPWLFAGTVADNIRLGAAEATDDEVRRAARLANAEGFVDALPEGFATEVGERGGRLSAGQRQRIALARAFLRDAPLLVLDEPTANLDVESAAAVQDAVERLMAGRTVLLIVHRLAMARGADRVVVLDRGRIVEEGRPAALESTNGAFAHLLGTGTAGVESPVTGPEPTPHERAAFPTAAFGRSVSPEDLERPDAVGPDAVAAGGVGPGSTVALLRRLAGLGRPLRGRIALSVLAGFATVASGIGLLATSAYLISKAALQPPILQLAVAIAGVRFFGISRGAFRYGERLASHDVSFRLLGDLRVRLYERIEPLAPAGLEAFRSGDLLHRLVADVDTLQNLFLRGFSPPLVAMLVAALAVGFTAAFLPAAGLVLLAAMVAGGAGVPVVARRLGRAPGRRLAALRSELAVEVVDLLQGVPELVAFGAADARLARVAAIDASLTGASRRAAGRLGVAGGLASLTAGAAVVGVLAVGVPAVRDGALRGVLLATLVFVAMAAFEAITPLPAAAAELERDLTAARRVFAVVDAEPAVRDPDHPLAVPAGGPVTLEGARLRYGPDLPWALDGVDLRLEPGRRIAVVGPSGAGKTTIAQVLLRFRDLDAGRATLAGRALTEYRQADVRRVIGLAAQDAHLFNTTIRENIRLARPDATDAELAEAARRARVLDWIESLPDGWQTSVGEGGVRVSGGERQRVALARALLADFPVLLLDEPTANLDAPAERALMADLLTATAGRSTLLVTHRLAGLDAVDEIVVLDRGRVVERGTHAALLAADGVYRRMWDLERGEPPARQGPGPVVPALTT